MKNIHWYNVALGLGLQKAVFGNVTAWLVPLDVPGCYRVDLERNGHEVRNDDTYFSLKSAKYYAENYMRIWG